MAIKTTFELFDIIYSDTMMPAITATDLNGDAATVSDSETTTRYIKRKYSERRYSVLTGGRPAQANEAAGDFIADMQMYLLNRQHNINRMYQALFDYDYSPIENVDRHESETTHTDDTVEYGKTLTDSGTDRTTYGKTLTDSGTDRTTYGKTLTDSGTDSTTYGKVETNSGTDTTTDTLNKTETHDGEHTTTNSKSGFNAPSTYTPDTKSVEVWDNDAVDTVSTDTNTLQHGHILTNSGSDSVAYGKTETTGGTDSIAYGKTETTGGTDSIAYGKTETAGGSDDKDIDTERELHVHGNIGVTSNVQLINEELDLRMKSLAEMIIDNFIDEYTFYA